MVEDRDGEHAPTDDPGARPSANWTDTQRLGRWAIFACALAIVAIFLVFILSALR